MKVASLKSVLNQAKDDADVVIELHGKLYELIPRVKDGNVVLNLDTPPALRKFEPSDE